MDSIEINMTPLEYKQLRKTIGNQHEVAALLGISRPTIARRESDQGKISHEAETAIRQLTKDHIVKINKMVNDR